MWCTVSSLDILVADGAVVVGTVVYAWAERFICSNRCRIVYRGLVQGGLWIDLVRLDIDVYEQKGTIVGLSV